MRSFSYTIHIERRPEAVWDYMMDFSKAPRWRNLVRKIDVLTRTAKMRDNMSVLPQRHEGIDA